MGVVLGKSFGNTLKNLLINPVRTPVRGRQSNTFIRHLLVPPTATSAVTVKQKPDKGLQVVGLLKRDVGQDEKAGVLLRHGCGRDCSAAEAAGSAGPPALDRRSPQGEVGLTGGSELVK